MSSAREWEPQADADDRGRPQRRRGGLARWLIGVVVLLIVVAGGVGFLFFSGAMSTAQPTTAVPTPTPRPTPTPAPTTDSGATAAGAAQATTAEAPQPIVTKQVTYGDWIYTCLKGSASQPTPVCNISQTLSDSKSKEPFFLWRIIATDKGLVSEWQTRTGIMVDQGIQLDTGGDKPIAIPFQFCTPSGCQAQANLAQDFVDALMKAPKATATVFPIGTKGITLPLSVKGLPDALNALKAPS